MRRLFSFLFLSVMTIIVVSAQQNISFRQGSLVSPQINPDNSVTFKLNAPMAKQVVVMGDWETGNGRGIMQKDKDGLWSYTTPTLPSEMYTYRFNIDGVLGLDPTNPFSKRDVGNLFSVFFISGGYADYYQVKDVPHGNINTVWYHSDYAGMDRRMTVYLPAEYYTAPKKSFPVFYLLHGSGGDETAWTELGNIPHIMDNLIAEGKAEPMIVVMPNGNMTKQAAPGETSENHSYRPVMSNMIEGNYKNGKYEEAFGEIINYVDNNYRTIKKKDARAIAGLSMGGFHTLYTTLNQPGKFSYISLFSAGIGTYYDEKAAAYSDLDGKLKTLKTNGYKMFWVGIGDADGLLKGNLVLCNKLDELNMPYEFHLSSRGHIWANWRQYILETVPRLFK